MKFLKALLKRFARVLGIGFYAMVFVFLGIYVSSLDWNSLAAININWGWLGVATILGLGTRFWFARIWIYFLNRSGAKIDKGTRSELYEVYAKSWLGRYIPGSVAWVAGKIYFASKLGIGKARLAISSFVEAVLQIVTVLLTASLLLVFDPRSYQVAGNWMWLLVAVAIMGLIAVIPAVLKTYASKAYELVRKAELDQQLIPNNRTLASGVGMFLVSSLLSGLAFYFVAQAVSTELGIEHFLFVLAASNLASAISMVAVFAPAGVGVREAIQITALLFVMPAEQALAATILMRVASIAWDGLFLLFAKIRRTAK